MIYGVYAICDEMAGEMMQPWMIANGNNMEQVAKRFAAEITNTTDLIKNNTGDYALYYLADFKANTGEYGNCNPVRLASITEIVNERRTDNGM